MKKLLPILLLLPLAACAPAAVRPTGGLAAQMNLVGNAVVVTLTNTGPAALELEGSCPRPFGVAFLEYPGKNTGGLAPQPLDTCTTPSMPPRTWAVGESLNVTVPVTYAPGTYTLKALATARVRIPGSKGTTYGAQNVAVPELTFTVK